MMHKGLVRYGSSHRQLKSKSKAHDRDVINNKDRLQVLKIKLSGYIYPLRFKVSGSHAQVTKPPRDVTAVVWRD